MVIPQGYPMWVVTRDSSDELVTFSGPYLVVAWNVDEDHVPRPVNAVTGDDAGQPFVGLTPDEAIQNAKSCVSMNDWSLEDDGQPGS